MLRRKNKPLQLWRCVQGYCAFYDAPPPKLFDHPQAMQDDRCLVECTTELYDWLYAHMDRWNVGIGNHKPLGGDRETARQGWRDKYVTTSLQMILHELDDEFFLEVDFDRYSPAQGLAPAVAHFFAEHLWHRLPRFIRRPKRKTNPYRVAKKLRKRGIDVEVV